MALAEFTRVVPDWADPYLKPQPRDLNLILQFWFGEPAAWAPILESVFRWVVLPAVEDARWVAEATLNLLNIDLQRSQRYIGDAANRQALFDGWSWSHTASLDLELVRADGVSGSAMIERNRDLAKYQPAELVVHMKTAILSDDTKKALPTLVEQLFSQASTLPEGLLAGIATVDRITPAETAYQTANGDLIRVRDDWLRMIPGYQWATVLGPEHVRRLEADVFELGGAEWSPLPGSEATLLLVGDDPFEWTQADTDLAYRILKPLLTPLRRPLAPVMKCHPIHLATEHLPIFRPAFEHASTSVYPQNEREAELWELNRQIVLSDQPLSGVDWKHWMSFHTPPEDPADDSTGLWDV